MKEQKGITLIALIITIIVMLILVAVTINVAMNGGIFTRAKEAKDKTQIEADKESLLMAAMACIGEDGKVEFNGEKGLNNNLPDGFIKISDGVYSKGGYTFIVDKNTGKITLVGTSTLEDKAPQEPLNPQDPYPPPQSTIVSLIKDDGCSLRINQPGLTVMSGQSYTNEIYVNEGYQIDSVTIIMGDQDITSTCYDEQEHIINIASVTDLVTITITTTPIPTSSSSTYSISYDLDNCTCTNTASTIEHGSSYNTEIVLDSGCSIPQGGLSILMGNDNITDSCCSQNGDNYIINISEVTGNIRIIAGAK